MARPIVSFDKLKESFYSRVTDFSIFDCGELNLLKVVLDGIKVDYTGKGKIRVATNASSSGLRLQLSLIRLLKSGQVKTIRESLNAVTAEMRSRPIIIWEPTGRVYSRDGKDYSFYADKLVQEFGRENIFFVVEGTKKHQHDADVVIPEYSLASLAAVNPDEKFFVLHEQVRATYLRILTAGIFTAHELNNIEVAFQQFLIQYAVVSFVLGESKAKDTYIWPHYHREGGILALRKKKIRLTELQHGLIAEEDIFYGFPERVLPIRKDKLFCDRILVYGEFWKQQVLKGHSYKDSEIEIAGYFPYTPHVSDEKVNSFRNLFPGKKIILVTTQTFLDELFTNYVRFLSKDIADKQQPYGILVKLHPAEKEELYSGLKHLGNVRIVNDSIDVLLKAADLHVSVYSTTMFDAIRAGVSNYSVFHPDLADYIRMFEREGVCTVIQPNENPIDHSADLSKLKPVSWYYESFRAEVIKS